MRLTLAVGTEKGAFFLRSDESRVTWTPLEPAFRGWKATAFSRTPGGDFLLATGSNWFGASLHRSTDLMNWDQIVAGPTWSEDSSRSLTQIWTLQPVGDRLYAGVDEAGLFSSDDDGNTWQPVTALNEHPTRSGWQPGFGGLCAHRIVADPADPDRMWVGISAVGVFRTDDGGASWVPKNQGVERAAESDEFPDIGWCVHGVVPDPTDANRLWRQEHMGVFRSNDGGDSWDRIENGLPARFGFPIVRDHASGDLFVVPLESDEFRLPVGGKLRVFRSRDEGANWGESGSGLPDLTYTGVLRGAMIADQLDPPGVFFGTTGGTVYGSVDAGDTWRALPGTYPRILSLHLWTDA